MSCAACMHGEHATHQAPPDAGAGDHWLIGFIFAACTAVERQGAVIDRLCPRHAQLARLFGEEIRKAQS